jgi:hypothetical protein
MVQFAEILEEVWIWCYHGFIKYFIPWYTTLSHLKKVEAPGRCLSSSSSGHCVYAYPFIITKEGLLYALHLHHVPYMVKLFQGLSVPWSGILAQPGLSP